MLRSRALHTVGQVCYYMARYEEAMPHLRESLVIAREHGDVGRIAIVLQELGMASLGLGDVEGARGHLQLAMQQAQQAGDQRALMAAVNAMAQLYRSLGQLELAAPLYEQALVLAAGLEDEQSKAIALLNVTMVATGQGNAAAAHAALQQAKAIVVALGSRTDGQAVLAAASGLAALLEDWVHVARFAAAADAEAGITQMLLDPADKAFLAPLWQRARDRLGDSAYAAGWAAGAMLSYEQAMSTLGDWLNAFSR